MVEVQTGRYKVGCDLYGGGTDMQLQIYEQKRFNFNRKKVKLENIFNYRKNKTLSKLLADQEIDKAKDKDKAKADEDKEESEEEDTKEDYNTKLAKMAEKLKKKICSEARNGEPDKKQTIERLGVVYFSSYFYSTKS